MTPITPAGEAHLAEIEAERAAKRNTKLGRREDARDLITGERLLPDFEDLDIGWWVNHRDLGADDARGGIIVDVGMREDGTRYVVALDSYQRHGRQNVRRHIFTLDQIDEATAIRVSNIQRIQAAKNLCAAIGATVRQRSWDETNELVLMSVVRLTQKERDAS